LCGALFVSFLPFCVVSFCVDWAVWYRDGNCSEQHFRVE
jgi:hypothetical protein